MAYRTGRIQLIGVLALLSTVFTGCRLTNPLAGEPQAGGDLRVMSDGPGAVVVAGSFAEATYSHDPYAETLFVLADHPLEGLLDGSVAEGQALQISLMWIPAAGLTPSSADATNISLRYVIVSHGEIGVYGGGGFGRPSGTPGDGAVTMSIESSNLRLIDATPGFADLLGGARATGVFTATLDAATTRQYRRQIQSLVSRTKSAATASGGS